MLLYIKNKILNSISLNYKCLELLHLVLRSRISIYRPFKGWLIRIRPLYRSIGRHKNGDRTIRCSRGRDP
jgi:hypothetical protein